MSPLPKKQKRKFSIIDISKVPLGLHLAQLPSSLLDKKNMKIRVTRKTLEGELNNVIFHCQKNK